MSTVIQAAGPTASRRSIRSTAAVLVGFVAVAMLSGVTDQVLHMMNVYPPWGEPMYAPGLNLLALSYRVLYTMLGGYVTARLAPCAPMRHVIVLAVVGAISGAASAIISVTAADIGPDWYPIAIAVTAFPSVWAGGRLYCSVAERSR